MRKTLAMGTLAALAGAAVLASCSGKKGSCPDSAWICGSDGKLYCHFLPTDLHPLDRACCPDPSTLTPASPDTGFELPFDGSLPFFFLDGSTGGTGGADEADAGAETPPDAGVAGDASTESDASSAPPAGPDAGGCPDAAYLDYFYGMRDAGLLPMGRDDAGIPYVYRCGAELCHQPWLGYDAGLQYLLPPDVGANCGPVGCQ